MKYLSNIAISEIAFSNIYSLIISEIVCATYSRYCNSICHIQSMYIYIVINENSSWSPIES